MNVSQGEVLAREADPGARNGRRVVIALTCWVLSSVGLLTSLVAVGASLLELVRGPMQVWTKNPWTYMALAMAYAWTALFVMSVAWVKRRRSARHWPVAGGLAGLTCAAFFAPVFYFFLPATALGLYLCWFHLNFKDA